MKHLLLVSLLFITGCTDVIIPKESPTSATSVTPTVAPDKVEFRVFGANLSAFNPIIIRHTDPINGVTLYQGGTPYFAAISSSDPTLFLFVEATGTGLALNSTLQVQIFVNGKLFREGFSQGFVLSAQANGTYRHSITFGQIH